MIYKNEVQNPVQSPELPPAFITAQMNFIFRARMLWRDLATWLRSYKVSLYGGVGNTEELSQRLFRMPLEYGNILKVFFGDQTTEQFINLLTQYIATLQSLFIAQYNNNIDEINKLTQQAYQIINTTAALLASNNPYWMQSEWVALLSFFTSLQIDESTTFLTKNYTRNIDIFDRILSFTNIMGDYFSEGITNYFSLKQLQQLPAT
jgi:hypothetical protein